MFLKRIAAIILALILLLQITACTKPSAEQSADVISQFDEATSSVVTSSEYVDSVASDGSSQQIASDDEENSSTQSETAKPQQNSSQQTTIQPDKDPEQTVDKPEQKPQENQNDNPSKEPEQEIVETCTHGDADPYINISKTQFYANYTPACCNLYATYRSKHGLLSGSLEVPGQYAQDASSRPISQGKYVRNTTTKYLDDGNTYVVLDANGKEAMRIHKAGGYITLEEVAAYMYAFGGSGKIPANYISKKKGNPNDSIWGEHLRVNHSYFIGDTDRYPYEPELPNISGCGGSLQYYEMDIGTTGTVTPGYPAKPYIQGSKINRGAARIVYARQDLNQNGIYEENEVYVFYTHNHYNDFREYLNYYGGWGEMFGNVTGGGEYSSDTHANPTPYVPTEYASF